MSKIETIVDALENKIGKVLKRQQVLKLENIKLKEALEQSQSKLVDKDLELKHWQEKYDTLKMANTILGSDNDKRETKLKINTLIREIDHCISQLSS
jgi:regulator of replication initiation timing